MNELVIGNPYLFFILVALLIYASASLIYEIFFQLPNRILRHLNIKKHGWPPPHCDADGDLLEEIEEDSIDETDTIYDELGVKDEY